LSLFLIESGSVRKRIAKAKGAKNKK